MGKRGISHLRISELLPLLYHQSHLERSAVCETLPNCYTSDHDLIVISMNFTDKIPTLISAVLKTHQYPQKVLSFPILVVFTQSFHYVATLLARLFTNMTS